MEIEEIEKRLKKIKEEANDNETAHWLADSLWKDVLVAISEGAINPKELAKECLKSSEIDFIRWFA